MMRLLRSPKNQQGFTLIETVSSIALAGILSSISAPNLFQWYNNQKIESGVQEVHSALQEAQRQAMRKGQKCTLQLSSTTITSTNNCLSQNISLSDGMAISTNLDGTTKEITFSYKGNTVASTSTDDQNIGTIVISSSTNSNEKRCLVISNGLGIMRTGVYQGSLADIQSTQCQAL